ncbi:TetR/AcrR family transcriptional regulator [Actinoplanes sp. L3-i22]|uniref:TetR/AcrR family transcriptional regulator n=1 Tax=Actinoplanes sp. L3-i22 TaxID=2836373 RepID=UPI001C77169C|nr:TetR/AcrR family transcriptional regulator [Actinoplanes sp. L3-i22]BCY12223.1 TetR family transcriptional regulator [Actinoplanes sp. L3-i22]
MRKLKDARRPEILDATLEIVTERGLDALSMRSVAQRLGLTPMALYGYFRSKEELLDALLGRLLEEVTPPPEGSDWRAAMLHLSYEMRAVARRHPTVLPLVLTRPGVSPGTLRLIDQVYRALLSAGVPRAEIPRLERTLSTFVIGHVLSEVSGRFSVGSLDPAARRAQLPPAELPGHQALAAELDAPVDWEAEFRANAEDLLSLVERRITG